ncbi:MAG: tetratricopeptide repeat protein, partial [Rikenellaceae bacterium]
MKTLFCFCALTFLFCLDASAQQERKFVREGNREYEKGNYDAAHTSYRKALNIDSTSYEALFNLTDALYQQKNYDNALQISEKLASDTLQTKERIASNRYNLGNIYFQKKEYQKAIDEYKKSLRAYPDDYQAKFNLAYAQMMLQNQQQQQNKDKQNKDQ